MGQYAPMENINTKGRLSMTIDTRNFAERFAAVLIAAVSVSALHAAHNEISTDFPMTAPTDFIAKAGVTNVYWGQPGHCRES